MMDAENMTTEPAEEHPKGEEIRKQVEYYFSDENLPSDAHLLMKTGGKENLPVSIEHICGFPRMRKYKPHRAVTESLKKSSFLEIVDDKFIKRRGALSIEPVVGEQEIKEAKIKEQKKKGVVPDQPWVTKGMLKATGFEEWFADAPVTPQAFKEEQSLYAVEISFETRIETAIQRYRARRKFHQQNAHIFDKFMRYGGIESGPRPFGGSDIKDFADKDAAEIAALTAQHFVMEDVAITDKWEVDFEGVARGFLSCHILNGVLLDIDNVQTEAFNITNLMRNFYNYLLHHNVCPEYGSQIYSAREICDLADAELVKTVTATSELPGAFNSAVSTLHGGASEGVYTDNAWQGADPRHRTLEDCRDIIRFALSAHGSEQQYAKISEIGKFDTVYNEQISLEVVSIEMPDEETRALCAKAQETKPFLSPLGKLHCRRWTYEFAPSFDSSREAIQRQERDEPVVLWIEEEILNSCYVGMKIEGEVRELDIGIMWLDSIRVISPSFFQWLPNELYGEQKARKTEEDTVRLNSI